MAAEAGDAGRACFDRLTHRLVQGARWQSIVTRRQIERSEIRKIAERKLEIVVTGNFTKEGDRIIAGAEGPLDRSLGDVAAIVGKEAPLAVLFAHFEVER